jgi:hypothetical protein
MVLPREVNMKEYFATVNDGNLEVIETDYTGKESVRQIFKVDAMAAGEQALSNALARLIVEHRIERLACSSSIDYPGEGGLSDSYPMGRVLDMAWELAPAIAEGKLEEENNGESIERNKGCVAGGHNAWAGSSDDGVTPEDHKRIFFRYLTSIPAGQMRTLMMNLSKVEAAKMSAPLTGQLEAQRDLVIAVGDAIGSMTSYDYDAISSMFIKAGS